MKKRIGIELIGLALTASVASADSYSLPFVGAGSATHHYFMQVDFPSTHTFDISGCPSGHVDWYITEFGGSPVETDNVDFFGFPTPSFTYTFSTPGTIWVRAEIYGDSGYLETHLCEVTVGSPDLRSLINLSAGTYQPGDMVSGTVNVSNVGEVSAEVGYVDLFFNLGSPSYDPSDQVERKSYSPLSAGSGDSLPFTFTIPPDAPAGTYYLTSLADATDTSDEGSNEGNNTDQRTTTVVLQPDLIVQNIWTEPANIVQGSNYVIKARIMNQGTAIASVSGGSQDVVFYLNSSQVGSDAYDNVAPNDTVVVQSGILTASSAGTYSTRADADANNEVIEYSEGNNSLTQALVVHSEPKADLVILRVWTEPAGDFYKDQYSAVFAEIKNQGDIFAITSIPGEIGMGLWLDGDWIIGMDGEDLQPGESYIHEFLPLRIRDIGLHDIEIRADTSSRIEYSVDEYREDNNSLAISVNVIEGDLADLKVVSFTMDPLYAWRPSQVSAVITNTGAVSASFGVFDRVCGFDVDGHVEYATTPLPVTIPPGGSYEIFGSITVPKIGTFQAVVSADPDDLVPEVQGDGGLYGWWFNASYQNLSWTASTTHDTDGDGMIDADEAIAGSEPDNSNSVWQCSLVLTNGGFRLSWPSISGRTYTVMRTINLTNDFIAISPPLPAYPPGNWFESINMPSNAFYRVKVEE